MNILCNTPFPLAPKTGDQLLYCVCVCVCVCACVCICPLTFHFFFIFYLCSNFSSLKTSFVLWLHMHTWLNYSPYLCPSGSHTHTHTHTNTHTHTHTYTQINSRIRMNRKTYCCRKYYGLFLKIMGSAVCVCVVVYLSDVL